VIVVWRCISEHEAGLSIDSSVRIFKGSSS